MCCGPLCLCEVRGHLLLKGTLPLFHEQFNDTDEPAIGPLLIIQGLAMQLDLAAMNLDLIQNVDGSALRRLPFLTNALSLVRKPVVYFCAVPRRILA